MQSTPLTLPQLYLRRGYIHIHMLLYQHTCIRTRHTSPYDASATALYALSPPFDRYQLTTYPVTTPQYVKDHSHIPPSMYSKHLYFTVYQLQYYMNCHTWYKDAQKPLITMVINYYNCYGVVLRTARHTTTIPHIPGYVIYIQKWCSTLSHL